jgi:hypothetical protein
VNFFEFIVNADLRDLKEKRWVCTDIHGHDGKLVNPMVYEFHRARIDFEIWYLGLYLNVRRIIREVRYV